MYVIVVTDKQVGFRNRAIACAMCLSNGSRQILFRDQHLKVHMVPIIQKIHISWGKYFQKKKDHTSRIIN